MNNEKRDHPLTQEDEDLFSAKFGSEFDAFWCLLTSITRRMDSSYRTAKMKLMQFLSLSGVATAIVVST